MQKKENLPTAKYDVYRKVFKNRFNLSFKTPSTDTCGIYESYFHKIRANINKTEIRFCGSHIKSEHADSTRNYRSSKDVVTRSQLHFTCKKTCRCPRQAAILSTIRQLWFCNFLVVIHGDTRPKKDVFFYTWMDHQSCKDANEICSAVADFFKRIWRRVIKRG